jgi:hypothetical protein
MKDQGAVAGATEQQSDTARQDWLEENDDLHLHRHVYGWCFIEDEMVWPRSGDERFHPTIRATIDAAMKLRATTERAQS